MKWHTVTVIPALPEKLKPLQGLARNLWYTWNPEVIDLWRRLDRDLWEESHHNPVRMLSSMSQQQSLERPAGTRVSCSTWTGSWRPWTST